MSGGTSEKNFGSSKSNGDASLRDVEKGGGVIVEDYPQPQESRGFWGNLVDGFKRAKVEDFGLNPNEMTEEQRAAVLSANAPLQRSLKNRHMQMIAIGGSIGTGLFVGTGLILRQGGQASVVLAYGIIGIMMYCTCQALGELAVTFPVSGSFVVYNTRFIDPSWGFAMAWNYCMQWMATFPTELVAASMTVQYWTEKNHQNISPAAWVAIFYSLIAIINLFGVKGYGEAEFIFSIIKVAGIIGFVIFGIVMTAGGNPKHEYIGAKYWHDPGAFHHGFKGLCSVFVTGAFSFAGTELVGLAGAESSDPGRYLPKATKQVFWRIVLFYLVSTTIIGFLLPYNSKSLLGGGSLSETATSPFVLGITRHGITALPSIMNVVILVAILSVANASVFGASRAICSLATAGQAPKIFTYIDRQGRPLFGILMQLTIGLLCFLAASDKEEEVFNWLMALSGLSLIFTWGSINLAHLRFRRALRVQGRDTSELTFCSQVGIYGSMLGLTLNILVLIAQFWIALFPLGESPDPKTFFQNYLSFPIVLVFYLGHKVIRKNLRVYIRAKNIDIDTGRREADLDLVRQEVQERKEYIRSRPFWYRIWDFWC